MYHDVEQLREPFSQNRTLPHGGCVGMPNVWALVCGRGLNQWALKNYVALS